MAHLKGPGSAARASREKVRIVPWGDGQLYPNNTHLYRRQVSITLRNLRRFRDALAYRQPHQLDDDERFRGFLERLHGQFGQPRHIRLDHMRSRTSVRYRSELRAEIALSDAREGVLAAREAAELVDRTRDLGEPGHELMGLHALAILRLAKRGPFEETVREVRQAIQRIGTTHYAVAELLTLRALFTGQAKDIDRALEEVQASGSRTNANWIRTEMWLAELGHPIDAGAPTQWLLPEEEVRANWGRVGEVICTRARELAPRSRPRGAH